MAQEGPRVLACPGRAITREPRVNSSGKTSCVACRLCPVGVLFRGVLFRGVLFRGVAAVQEAISLHSTELGWAGLGWAGAGLGWAGLGWAGLGWTGLGWAGYGGGGDKIFGAFGPGGLYMYIYPKNDAPDT